MLKKYTQCLAVVLIAFAVVSPAHAMDEHKKEVIKELLDITGADQIALIMASNSSKAMIEMLKKTKPDTPPAVFKIIDEEVNNVFKDELATGSLDELMYPLYDEKFTTPELEEILAFYKTPTGQKVIKVLPGLTQQGMIIGQKWAQGLAPKLQERLQVRLEEEGLGKK